MHPIIWCYIIQQLLLFTFDVESLRGKKIVSVHAEEYSFIASLQDQSGQHFCTGTVITNQHVITAGDCLYQKKTERVRVALGLTNLRTAMVRYTVAFWLTYEDWATRLRLLVERDFNDIAVIILSREITNDVQNIRPIRLSILNKQQVQGKTATIIGWDTKDETLEKGSVDILRDDDCRRNIRLILNVTRQRNDRILCTSAKPYILLQNGDSGGPLLDKFGSLLGVHISIIPQSTATWGDFTDEFLHPYKVNLHASISYRYFDQFITEATSYRPQMS